MMNESELAGRRCVVLGAGGFIGTNLCTKLQAAGAEVTGFGRSPRSPQLARHAWIEGDFGDASAMARAIDSAEVVFHLISSVLPAQSNIDPADGIQRDLIASVRLLELCRDRGVRKVIFLSSGGTVYGRGGAEPLREDAPTEPISSYGIVKLAIEKYLRLFEYLHDVEHVVLRVANPYGPFQSPRRPQGVISAIIDKALRGQVIEIWGDGTVVRDFIYIDDVVQAVICAAAYTGEERVFNVGSGVGRSLLEVINCVERLIDRGPLSLVFKEARAADVPVNILNADRLSRETGWRPQTDLRTGLERTAEWLRSRPPEVSGYRDDASGVQDSA